MTSVLIVDDEPMLREELQESLELEDFAVTPAENVDHALKLCETEDYDFVVTDLKMPVRGGLELIAELKQQGHPAMCIVVSGHGAESSRDAALSLGAKACFAKPLNVDDLIETINAHI